MKHFVVSRVYGFLMAGFILLNLPGAAQIAGRPSQSDLRARDSII